MEQCRPIIDIIIKISEDFYFKKNRKIYFSV